MAHHRGISAALVVLGLLVGGGGLALGAFLASGNNGWSSALLYSVVGVIGAPLAGFSWGSRRSKRRQIIAGIALLLGIIASMGLMLEVTQELSGIAHAWSQVPWAVAAWLVIWIVWQSAALIRLILFVPPRTRSRLSSRRGDGGR
jgi:hypothetical protein